jgi:arabinoxylan arabinofuranohydrolase
MKTNKQKHLILLLIQLSIFFSVQVFAQNPFLPPWEYIPDGEPRVFGDRVYIYGSHDKAGSQTFCDTKHVVWSAPINNPTNWRMESVSFYSKADANGIDDVPWSDNDLYAPDVVEKGGKYYMYFYVVGAPGGVAVSDVPGGPFKLISKYKVPVNVPDSFANYKAFIDPGVLVDDDGQVYIYCGYLRSYMAQINPDNMYEILPNTYKDDIIPTTPPFNFFEAASPRKINGIYYMIYADGGLMVYATSTSPKGPFKYGGVIIRNGRDYPGGNIHGSLCNVNGQWYIFYHRMTNNTIMSRKACVEKVHFEPDGSIKEVDMTSMGFADKLDPYKENSTYIACVLTGGNYITEVDSFTHPVIKNKNNCVIGFKYYDFTSDITNGKTNFSAWIKGKTASGTLEIWIDSTDPTRGTQIGSVSIENNGKEDTSWRQISTTVDNVTGVHGLYFKFVSNNDKDYICDIKSFAFSKVKK